MGTAKERTVLFLVIKSLSNIDFSNYEKFDETFLKRKLNESQTD